jgi:hypothetical protein
MRSFHPPAYPGSVLSSPAQRGDALRVFPSSGMNTRNPTRIDTQYSVPLH